MYDLETNEFIISRDVVFFEDQFPGFENSVSVTPPILHTDLPLDDWQLISDTQHQQHDATNIASPVPTTTDPLNPNPITITTTTMDVLVASMTPTPTPLSTSPLQETDQAVPAETPVPVIYHGFDPFSSMVYKYFTIYILYILSY